MLTGTLLTQASTLCSALNACPGVDSGTKIRVADGPEGVVILHVEGGWVAEPIGIPVEREAQSICERVARDYGVDLGDVLGACRETPVVEARMVAIYLIRHATSASYPQIAAVFGKDHKTIMSAVSRCPGVMTSRPKMRSRATVIAHDLGIHLP